MINGAVDPASNANPKRLFRLNIERRVLTGAELSALIVVSAKIAPMDMSLLLPSELSVPTYIHATADETPSNPEA